MGKVLRRINKGFVNLAVQIYNFVQRTIKRIYVNNKSILLWCLGIVSLWRIGLEFINQSIVLLFPNLRPDTRGVGHGLYRWMFWDGGWYDAIVRRGYVNLGHAPEPLSVAFFPGFPGLVRVLDKMSPLTYVETALVLNFALTVGIVAYVYKLTLLLAPRMSLKRKHAAAKWAVIMMLAFPASLFFAAFYADALLVFAGTAAIYYGLTRRYIAAGIFIGVATLTKSIAVVLLPVLLLIMIQNHHKEMKVFVQKQWLKILATFTLGVSGICAYMLYLLIKFDEPLFFYKIQKYWDRGTGDFFVKRIWEVHIRNVLEPSYYLNRYNYLVEIFMILLLFTVLVLSIWLIVRRQQIWLGVLSLLTVLIPISTGRLTSLNRYVLLLTPLLAFIVPRLLRLRYGQQAFTAIVFISTLVLVYLTVGFLQGSYFAG